MPRYILDLARENETNYCKLLNPPSPTFFASYFEAKFGRGHLPKYSISLMQMLAVCCIMLCIRSIVMLSRRMEALLTVYYGKTSSACVDSKPKDIEVTCIVSGQLGISLYHKQHKSGYLQVRLPADKWKVPWYQNCCARSNISIYLRYIKSGL